MKKFPLPMTHFLVIMITIGLFSTSIMAQVGAGRTVTVSLSVIPPYSTNAKDYVQQGNNVMITITNLAPIPQQVVVIPSLTGSNGVKAALRPDYMPPAGLLLAANQTRTLTLNQLKATNSTVNLNDIQLATFSQQDYANNRVLPEGTYTVCVTVKNFQPTVVFSEQACATLLINSYDPPIILNPVHNSTVKPLQPQFINFSWTPSGIAGKTRYSFKLFDLNAVPLNNINDAFENNNILPFYQQTNIITNSLILDNGKPKLTEGHKYALQVVASDPQNKLLFKNNGKSQVTVFTYKDEFGITNNPPPANGTMNDPAKGPCVAPAKWNGVLKQTNKNGIPNGSDIAVGHFVMRNTSFTQSNGSYSGTGEILVHFLNTKLKVEFTNIKIGDDNRFFDGKITAKVANNTVLPDAMAKDRTGNIESLPKEDEMMSYLGQSNRKVNTLNPGNPALDLPLHLDNNGQQLGIVGMIFEPTMAYINAIMNASLPPVVGDSYLLFSDKGIQVHPNGFTTAEVELPVAKETNVTLSDKLSLTFFAGADKTIAAFDCSGIKNMDLAGAMTLARTIALPLNNSFDVINDDKVKVTAPFKLENITSISEFLVDNISFSHKFVIPDANDFPFECKNLSIDFSTTQNGSGYKQAYPDKANKKDWIGIYIQNITLYLPEGFKKEGGGRMTVSAEKAFVDKMGFTGSLLAENPNGFSKGTLASWGVQLDKIDLKVAQSKLTGGGIGGKISLPLGDNTNLGFFATVSKGDANGAKVQLKVETQDEIDANLFLAKIKLFEGSSIEVGKDQGKYYAKAKLNGELSIAISSKKQNSNVSRFDLPNIKFQELTIDGKDQPNYVPNFDMKFVSLQNQKGLQAKIGGFELNLNDLQFKKSGQSEAGLSLDLGISLFGGGNDGKNGAGAKTGFTIWAKHNGSKFLFNRASLDSIAIDADMGVAKLKGSLGIYDEDPTYGNGFRGNVSASLAGLGVGIAVSMQYGKTLGNSGYKYWYFDAMVDFGSVGLNIPGTAASLYGFGGGAWCNMTRSGGNDVIKPGSFTPVKKEGPAPSSSGVTMTPQKDIAGFKAAVLFGITGSREAFNGDLTFEMELNSKTLAVNHIKLAGNAYLMQNPVKLDRRDPSKAFLYASALIEYDAPTRVLSGNFGAHVNIVNIIQGGGDISFKFDMPDRDKNGNVIKGQELKWYIKVGQWTPGKDPFEDDARLHAEIGFDASVLKVEIKLQGYFMVGNDLPSGLPPLPDEILAMTASMGAPIKKDLPSSVSNTQSLAFAFGAGIKLEAGFDIEIVKAYVVALAGFDVLISDLNATCDGKEMGFNGWYAQGQAYAYIGGAIEFLGLEVASVQAGAVFQVKLPNPTWVKGDVLFKLNILHIIKGSFWKTIERGHICDNMKMDINPFEATKLIKNMTPGDLSKNVNPLDAAMQVNFTYSESPIKIYNAFTEDYDYYFSQNQVKLLDKNKKEISKSDYVITEKNGGRDYVLTTKKTLEAFTDYYIWAKASIAGEKAEEKTIKFTTGDRPSTFGMADVLESYPLPNQRFFMKEEMDGKAMRGFIKLKQDLAYLFQAGQVNVLFYDKSDKMVAHAKASAGTQNGYEEKSTSTVYFDIPKELKTSSIYQIKILGPDPKAAQNNNSFGKVVFAGFWFGTSKYANFQDKINTFKIAKTGYVRHKINVPFKDKNGNANTAETDIYVPVLMLQGGEELDGYEMFGFYNTVNNQEGIYGKLFHAFSETGSDFLADMTMKYVYLKTRNGYVRPELTDAEFESRYKIAKTAAQAIVNIRPPGYPFDQPLAYGSVDNLFQGGPRMFWMKNIQAQESELRSKGYLTGNEKIGGPIGPLTSDEINGGGNSPNKFVNPGMGLSNGGPEKKVYYALLDYSPLIAGWAHAKWVSSFFKESSNANADIFKSYKIAEKLGIPKMPSGKYEVTLQADAGIGTGSKTATVIMNYNYNPPH